jgi:hypothetical protein
MSMDKPMAEKAEEGLEIEVVDDTPEPDRGKSKRPEGAEPEVPDDDEIASYSDNVQKRIKKLKYEYHEERRRKEAAMREIEEAAQITRRLLEERNAMAERLAARDAALLEQAKVRAQVQMEKVEREYRDAYEVGDADRILAAQRELMKLTTEQREIENYRPAPPQRIEPEQVRPQSAAASEPDEKAKNWMKANPWFGQDEEMSGYAYGVHERLIKREGITPLSDEYYERIDAAMRRRFPEHFEEEDGGEEVDLRPRAATPRKTPVVAPATRAVAARPPRKVQLTATQVALAKRLNLTPEQYAEELVKEMMNG